MSNKLEYTAPSFDYWPAEKLNLIEAQMSGGSGLTGDGTYTFPYVIDLDITRTFYGNECWFKCTSYGATDFTISADKEVSVLIYKKNSLSNLLIKEVVVSENENKKIVVWKKSEIDNGVNTYIIGIATTNASYYSNMQLTINEHRDKKIFVVNATWKPEDNSVIGQRDGYRIFDYCFYVNEDLVGAIYDVVNSSEFLTWYNTIGDFVIGSIALPGAIKSVLKKKLAEEAAEVASEAIADILMKVIDPFNFKRKLINELRDVTGYSAVLNSYARGAGLIQCYGDGILSYDIVGCNDSVAYGQIGVYGCWV